MLSSSSGSIGGGMASRPDRGSSNGSASRPATGGGSTSATTPTSSTSRLSPESLDLTALPTRLQAIAATLGAMLSETYSKAEIARFYGKSRPWVSARLQELEDGIRALAAGSTGSTTIEGRESLGSKSSRPE